MRATLELTRSCNQNCVFCARAGMPKLEDVSFAQQLDALNGEELTFIGGEPTLVPELTDLVARAKAKGFKRIGLQTNALKLADEKYTHGLADAGLTDVHVTLHGADAAVHDYHSNTPGSFSAVMTAMGIARARGLALVASTVVTRSNFRVLAPLPQLLASKGVVAWQLAMANVAGNAAGAMDRVVPRHALALPYVLHALEAARRLGIEGFVRDAPLCLLGPFASRNVGPPGEASRFGAQTCTDCAARSTCPGVDATYLARFGAEELKSLTAAPPPLGEAKWAHVFHGMGEAFVPENIVVPQPPSKAREALFDLGKANAAKAEVAGRERKTGDALKEILPQVFES
ncbi:MAG: radical SAM protein [Archangium sp.]|nr:radical SAM protein [Archangium sp.]